MTYTVGIDIGTTFTAAAVATSDGVHTFQLGARGATIPTVVALGEEGQFLIGESAVLRARLRPQSAIREFKRFMGADAPMVLGTTPVSPQRLYAAVLSWVMERVASEQGGPADRLVLTHPANWGAHRLDALREAVELADISVETTLTSEPEAAAIHYVRSASATRHGTIGVYDLGGGTFDAVVVRTDDGAAFEILGEPKGLNQLGGIDFDHALLELVVANVRDEWLAAAADPAAELGVRALQEAVVAAKETLSTDIAVSVPVQLPGIATEVRVTRREFEQAIESPLRDSVRALERAIESADLEPEDLDAVLLVGGSSRVPRIAEMVTAQLGRPVAVDANPKLITALGAAAQHMPLSATPAPVDPEPEPLEPDPEPEPLEPEPDPKPKPNRRLLLTALGGAVVVALVLFLALRPDDDPDVSPPTTTATSTSTTSTIAPGRVATVDSADAIFNTQVVAPGSSFEIEAITELDDGRLVSGDNRGQVVVWDPDDPSTRAEIVPGIHADSVESLRTMSDGKRVLSTSFDGTVKIWNPDDDDPSASAVVLPFAERTGNRLGLEAIELTDGHVASADFSGVILVWDPSDPDAAPFEYRGHADRDVGVRLDANGDQNDFKAVTDLVELSENRIASVGYDGSVQVWSRDGSIEPLVYTGHGAGSWYVALALLPDGRLISAGGSDLTEVDSTDMHIWDPDTGETEVTLPASPWASGILVLSETRVAVFSGSGISQDVEIWDLSNENQPVATFTGHTSQPSSITLLADGTVATGGSAGRVLVWDPADMTQPMTEFTQHRDDVAVMVALTDGSVAGAITDPGGTVQIWDPSSSGSTPIATFTDHETTAITLTQLDDERIASGDFGGNILIWDAARMETAESYGSHSAPITSIVQLDDRTVASTQLSAGGGVHLWDPADPSAVLPQPAVPSGEGNAVFRLIALADGKIARFEDDWVIRVSDPSDLAAAEVEFVEHVGTDAEIAALAELPDRRIASAHGNDILLWHPDAPGEFDVGYSVHSGSVTAITVLSDGRVASASFGDGEVHVWDPADPAEVSRYIGHPAPVISIVDLGSDRIASGDAGGDIHVWTALPRAAGS